MKTRYKHYMLVAIFLVYGCNWIDARQDEPTIPHIIEFASAVDSIAIYENYLAAGLWLGGISVYNLDTDTFVYTITTFDRTVKTLVFDPSGTFLVSGGNNTEHNSGDLNAFHAVRIWNFASGELEDILFEDRSLDRRSIAFNASGDLLFATTFDHSVYAWFSDTQNPLNSGYILRTDYPFSNLKCTSIAFHPVEDVFACATLERTIQLYDSASFSVPLPTVFDDVASTFHNAPVTELSFSSNGQWLASGDQEGTILLWDMETGVVIRLHEISIMQTVAGRSIPTGKPLPNLAFLCEGRFLATSNSELPLMPENESDNHVRIWDTNTGALVEAYDHGAMITDIVATEQYIISGGKDGKVRIWPHERCNN